MYLHIIYINKHETYHLNTGSDSTSVEHWSSMQQVPGSDLTSAGAMLWVYYFFLSIEDYGYSKSRTKIGMSVDT